MSKKNKNKRYEDSYKSSELLLEYIYREYTKEIERARAFEAKIPILLTLITLFLGFVLGSDNAHIIDRILKIGEQFYFAYMLLQLLTVVLLLVSGGCMVYVICLKEYRTLDTSLFTNEELNKYDTREVAFELIRGYDEVLEQNTMQNDKKGIAYTFGIKMLSAGVISFIILSVVNGLF